MPASPQGYELYLFLYCSFERGVPIRVNLTGSTEGHAVNTTQRRSKMIIIANNINKDRVKNQSIYVNTPNIPNMYPYYDSKYDHVTR